MIPSNRPEIAQNGSGGGEPCPPSAKMAALSCNARKSASVSGIQTVTATQIAAVLGMKRQAVQWHLRETPPHGAMVVHGVMAQAWAITSLPAALQERLDEIVQQKNYRSKADIFSNPPKQWQPKWPITTLHQDCIDEATRLQRAQEYYLANQNSPLLTEAELMRHALEDYRRSFGHTISERHCRNLLNRTIERDGGRQDWQNLALYLPDQLKQKPVNNAQPASAEFPALNQAIAGIKKPGEPGSDERELLWLRACESYQSAGGNSPKQKRAILNLLWQHAPNLAKSPNALRVSFDRKYKSWLESKGDANAIKDRRTEKLGSRKIAAYDPEQIRLIKFTAATRHEGKAAPAVRELAELGLITDNRIKSFLDTRTSKTYLPKSLREHFKDLPAFRLAHLGPRAIAKMVPPRQLTYDGIHSMFCLVADDLTSPVYVSVPDGEGWFKMTRCQLLCVADFRSLFITSFALNPSGQYNSLDVRTVYTTTFAQHGMPRFILREGGLWRNSRNANSLAAIGTGRSAEAPFSDAEVEIGLERSGVRIKSSIENLCRDVSATGIHFREAFRARSKPIERAFDPLQSLMAKETGFCGRDEKIDCPEIVRKNLELVRTRKAHPQELGFYSFEQWVKRLQEIIAQYNRTPQEGRRLRHPVTGAPMSPNEAFEVFWNHDDPPARFDASIAVLLSHMKIPVEVKAPDLRRRQFPSGYIVVRGNIYCGAETGTRIGDKLLAHFNPHRPEFCTFTDMKLRHPFTMKRLEATNALFVDEQTRISSQQAAAPIAILRTEFRAMQAEFSNVFGSPFRRNIVDSRTLELNQHVAVQANTADAEQRAKQNRGNAIKNKGRKLGLPTAILGDDDETRKALEGIEEARRQHAAEEASRLNSEAIE